MDDELQTDGVVNLAQLTTKYDLPLEVGKSHISLTDHGRSIEPIWMTFYMPIILTTHRVSSEAQKLLTLISVLFLKQFLRSSFVPRLGSTIHGQIDSFDPNVFYTRAFLSRHRARVTGATRGVTRPTPVASLLQAVGCEPRIFFAVLDELIQSKKVAGE